MFEIQKKNRCTGCGACVNICTFSAIQMLEDTEGFPYPVIDYKKCTDCTKCQKICPTFSRNRKTLVVASQKSAYLCATNDSRARMSSSSGGVFYALALKCIEKGGVVFGAKFDENWNVIHASATDEVGIKKFQVSKYVQSNIGDTYKKAKVTLDSDKPVLFSGTPCQIAGLKAFLGKQYPHLLTCDFICHGVPSPAVWRDYVLHREKMAGAKAVKICFRVKEAGWLKSFFFFFSFANNEEYRQYKTQDTYYKGFLNNLFVRPCCHRCSFKRYNRASDMTIADAWGVKKYAPEFYDEKGISFVIIHTEEGMTAFKAMRGALVSREIEIYKPIQYNVNFSRSEIQSLTRGSFFSDWKSKGVEAAIEGNLKFYDKLFRKSISIIRDFPLYVKRIGLKRL